LPPSCGQRLTTQFVGPEACTSIIRPTKELAAEQGCCRDCKAKNKQRVLGRFAYTYHDYAAKYIFGDSGSQQASENRDYYGKPDLIVAFNSGIHEMDTDSWRKSVKVMMDLDVPTFFTSYNKSEALQDFDILQKLQANLLQKTVKPNPFAEDMWRIEVASRKAGTDNFYKLNMYGVLFQGRRKGN